MEVGVYKKQTRNIIGSSISFYLTNSSDTISMYVYVYVAWLIAAKKSRRISKLFIRFSTSTSR